MNQLSFDFTANKIAFSNQDYKKVCERLKEKEEEVKILREKLKKYNSLSRKNGNK